MYQVIGALGNGFYEAFSVADGDEQKRALVASFATPEQRAFNAAHHPCPTCKGWGYRMRRIGRHVERENVGCETCFGLGVLPNDERAK